MTLECSDGCILKGGRVAPIKKLTVPRLELCAAELLDKLIVEVKVTCSLESVPMTLYSFLTAVLNGFQNPLMELKTYTANRVQRIPELVSRNV